jgi:hypothetical protein
MNKNVLNKLVRIESKVELGEVKVDLATSDDINALNKEVQKAQYNDGLLLKDINKVDDALKAIKIQLADVNSRKIASQKAWDIFDNRYAVIRKNAEKSLADIGMKWSDLGNGKTLDATMDAYDMDYRMVQDTKLPTL